MQKLQTLGTKVIRLPECPLDQTIPAPAVLQKQLNNSLEAYIASSKQEFLEDLEAAFIEKHKDPLTLGLIITLYLHVLKKNICRLSCWVHQNEAEIRTSLSQIRNYPLMFQNHKWCHPGSPLRLIYKNIVAARHFSGLVARYTTITKALHDHIPGRGLYIFQHFDLFAKLFTATALGSKRLRFKEIDESSMDYVLSKLTLFP